ncbi:MAG: hypothetical protein ACR2QB_10565 [Gammaproteobacteria bacterium]
MNNWLWLLLGMPAGIVATWFLMQRRTAPESDLAPPPPEEEKTGPLVITRNEPSKKAKRYYGVYVQIDNNPCEAVRAISEDRYLSTEAPRLPLANCNREKCRCMLQPTNDRRAGHDRRGDSFAAYGTFKLEQHTKKREIKRDRRNADT